MSEPVVKCKCGIEIIQGRSGKWWHIGIPSCDDAEPVAPGEHCEPAQTVYTLKACDKCGKEFTYDYECHCGVGWHQVPAAPAESQGVERAQPVEEPREPTCDWCGCQQAKHQRNTLACPVMGEETFSMVHKYAPVEGVERVTDDAPARFEPRLKFLDYDARRSPKTGLYCCKCQKDLKYGHSYRKVYLTGEMMVVHPEDMNLYVKKQGDFSDLPIGDDCARTLGIEWTAPAQPAKHTDDRPAETISEIVTAEVVWVSQDYAKAVIVKNQELRAELGRAETRIEVLEAALRDSREALEWCDMFLKCGLHPGRIENEGCPTCVLIDVIRKRRAALAAPSGVKEKEKV